MYKVIITLTILVMGYSISIAQSSSQKEGKTVSETLKLIDGQWRMMYKIIDGNVIYDRRYQLNNQTSTMQLHVDTMSIHTYNIDDRGRTKYTVNWENPDGQVTINDWDVSGSWDVKQTADGIDIHVMNAYYPGCPNIIRRVVNINEKQLLLQDSQTGDQYYFTRR